MVGVVVDGGEHGVFVGEWVAGGVFEGDGVVGFEVAGGVVEVSGVWSGLVGRVLRVMVAGGVMLMVFCGVLSWGFWGGVISWGYWLVSQVMVSAVVVVFSGL